MSTLPPDFAETWRAKLNPPDPVALHIAIIVKSNRALQPRSPNPRK